MPRSRSSQPSDTDPRPLCRNLARTMPPLAPHVAADPTRAAAIIGIATKWVNGTVLHYWFFGDGHFAVPTKQANAIRAAFAEWKAIGIGLDFQEVDQPGEAEIRIGYSAADHRSASYVGRQVLNIPLTEPTTVYGWDLTSHYGHGTALHELGHALGMEHEHQNPFAGIVWHEEAVYAALAAPPNEWDRRTTFHNILAKLSTAQVQGSTWDPDSIMEYEFGPGLIDKPDQYDVSGLIPPATLSAADKEWAVKWYPSAPVAPPVLQPFQALSATLTTGQQMDVTIAPPASRRYTIEARGASDVVLVLFENVDGAPRYLAGDDTSGQDRPAVITHKLFSGRTYTARLRVYHPGLSGTTSLTYS